ncbi:Uncharacterized conserved protein YbaP, TraB family [Chitinophaga sp. YR573]|nr:Uncharacterized conserved protein YbaP, TraB family [Chitinophaga sp. YR573]
MPRLYYFCYMFYSYIGRRHCCAAHFIRIFILLALLVPATVLRAQNDNRSHYQLLWRINGPGMASPSFLFGTMHLTDNRVFEFSDSVLTALRNANSFAMEVDLDSMMAYMLSPEGPLLDTVNHMRRLLTADEYHYIDSLIIEKTGAPLAQLKLKRMWFVEKLLLDEEEALSKNTDQKGENIFLDGWLHQKATGLHKSVYSLERLQNQLHIMSADFSEMQKEVFLWTLGYHDAGSGDAKEKTDRFNTRVNFLDSLVNMYYKADLEKISKFVNSAQSEDSDEGPGLVVRNLEMADNLALLINKGSVFAAVGVAHLPGEKGIISLLRAKGYTVTSVKATFTGAAKRDRQRLDSMKGYSLNKIADGYSVMLPGIPISYPIPNMNRKMYIGNNGSDVGFAFSIDIPQLGMDKRELVNTMIANMARQGNAKLQKSYPITYRNIPGTEAVLLQENVPLYIRLFIRNNRAFVFMYNSGEKDSSSRKDFFKSVRFYDIARPVTIYDTLNSPQLGFSAMLPLDVNHIQSGNKEGVRPVEAYSGLDDANNISYILRIEKMQRGYYNINDNQVLEGVRAMLLQEDSTLQLIDSTVTEREGLPLYQLIYNHSNGFISRLHFIPRGNLAYFLLCVYDGVRTDSSYWQRFLNGFHISPLKAQAPAISFVPTDSSFTIAGPELFTGGAIGHYDESSRVHVYLYRAMDSTSHSMYVAEVDKYARYYNNKPDSLLKEFVHSEDTTFIITSHKQSVWEGLPVYETEMKGRHTGLRWYRRAVVAGHTIYRLSVIMPAEVIQTGYAQQFLASFHPGSREKADTFRLQENRLSMLLKDLQSTDTTIFNIAHNYLDNLEPDSADKGFIIDALAKPFPADTGENNAKVQLLLSLKDLADDNVVHAAERLFPNTTDAWERERVLRFLNGIPSDSAIRTFLRLAPEMPESAIAGSNIFSYSFENDSLYQKYMPAMIATAERSVSFLQAFTAYTYGDSLWLSPQFDRYGLERLLPGIMQQFERLLKEWKNREPDEDNDWKLERSLLSTGRILALPGMPASVATGFRQLLADTVMTLRSLGARGLMNKGIHVDDKTLNSVLADNSEAYTFIQAVQNDKQLSQIRHLLTQELLGRSYVAYYMGEDYTITDIEQVTRVKVQQGKQPAEWLVLYRYKTDESEDWEYVLNGPHPLDPTKLNTEPGLIHTISEKSTVTDKKKLSAEAMKAYKNYLEEESAETN